MRRSALTLWLGALPIFLSQALSSASTSAPPVAPDAAWGRGRPRRLGADGGLAHPVEARAEGEPEQGASSSTLAFGESRGAIATHEQVHTSITVRDVDQQDAVQRSDELDPRGRPCGGRPGNKGQYRQGQGDPTNRYGSAPQPGATDAALMPAVTPPVSKGPVPNVPPASDVAPVVPAAPASDRPPARTRTRTRNRPNNQPWGTGYPYVAKVEGGHVGQSQDAPANRPAATTPVVAASLNSEPLPKSNAKPATPTTQPVQAVPAPPASSPSKAAPAPEPAKQITGSDQQAWIDAHNAARAGYEGAGQVGWSDGAYQQAAANLAAHANNCKLDHTKGGKFGENLYGGSGGGGKASAGDVVGAWMSEAKDFNYGDPNGNHGGEVVGHFTAIVWKNVKAIGCAAGSCGGSGTYVACCYDPSPNFIGQYDKQVGRPV